MVLLGLGSGLSLSPTRHVERIAPARISREYRKQIPASGSNQRRRPSARQSTLGAERRAAHPDIQTGRRTTIPVALRKRKSSDTTIRSGPLFRFRAAQTCFQSSSPRARRGDRELPGPAAIHGAAFGIVVERAGSGNFVDWIDCHQSVTVHRSSCRTRLARDFSDYSCRQGKTLVAFESVANIKRQFAIHAKNLHRAVDRINVHDSNRSRRSIHGTQQIIIGIDNDSGLAVLIQLGDGESGFRSAATEELLQCNAHLWQIWIFQYDYEIPSIRPGFRGALTIFD